MGIIAHSFLDLQLDSLRGDHIRPDWTYHLVLNPSGMERRPSAYV